MYSGDGEVEAARLSGSLTRCLLVKFWAMRDLLSVRKVDNTQEEPSEVAL